MMNYLVLNDMGVCGYMNYLATLALAGHLGLSKFQVHSLLLFLFKKLYYLLNILYHQKFGTDDGVHFESFHQIDF